VNYFPAVKSGKTSADAKKNIPDLVLKKIIFFVFYFLEKIPGIRELFNYT